MSPHDICETNSNKDSVFWSRLRYGCKIFLKSKDPHPHALAA